MKSSKSTNETRETGIVSLSVPMNVNNDRATDKTSKINISHALALCSIKKEFNEKEWIEKEFYGPHSNCSSPFSTPSVADSVEFTETNPASVIDKQAPASDQQAPGDSVMPDAADGSKIEEFSTGAKFALFMTQVCLSFLKFKTIYY